MMRNVFALTTLLVAMAVHAAPFRDPGTPPAASLQAARAENRARAASVGVTLDVDAEGLLRASFDAADTAHAGTLSRAQAQTGGFGWIANRFDAIDTRHAGRVSFDDVRRYLALQRAGAATK
jgi:hypothetical protein